MGCVGTCSPSPQSFNYSWGTWNLRSCGCLTAGSFSYEQKRHPVFLDFQMPSEHFVESVCYSAWVACLRLIPLISVSCFLGALEPHILLVLLNQNDVESVWWKVVMLSVYLSFAALNCVVIVLTGLCSDSTWAGKAVFGFGTHCKWIEADSRNKYMKLFHPFDK